MLPTVYMDIEKVQGVECGPAAIPKARERLLYNTMLQCYHVGIETVQGMECGLAASPSALQRDIFRVFETHVVWIKIV